MIELPIEVTPEGGEPLRVVATSRDIRQWEKMTKDFSFSNAGNLRMGDIYGIAYQACRRQKIFAGTLVDFEAEHDLDVLNEEVEEVDPTRPVP